MTSLLVLWLAFFLPSAIAADEKWKAEMIADALLAAPPSVTHNASIYAWESEGKMVALRHGAGPYNCIASGSFSVRLGKPPLPVRDPMCMDQNSWAFLQAVWSEKNPLEPEKPYPTAPGLVWMLAGMSVNKGTVAFGNDKNATFRAIETQTGDEVFQMTPHIMIMPVPFDKSITDMSTSYNLETPLDAWIMAAGTPIEHLMMHLSEEDVESMMKVGQ